MPFRIERREEVDGLSGIMGEFTDRVCEAVEMNLPIEVDMNHDAERQEFYGRLKTKETEIVVRTVTESSAL